MDSNREYLKINTSNENKEIKKLIKYSLHLFFGKPGELKDIPLKIDTWSESLKKMIRRKEHACDVYDDYLKDIDFKYYRESFEDKTYSTTKRKDILKIIECFVTETDIKKYHFDVFKYSILKKLKLTYYNIDAWEKILNKSPDEIKEIRTRIRKNKIKENKEEKKKTK